MRSLKTRFSFLVLVLSICTPKAQAGLLTMKNRACMGLLAYVRAQQNPARRAESSAAAFDTLRLFRLQKLDVREDLQPRFRTISVLDGRQASASDRRKVAARILGIEADVRGQGREGEERPMVFVVASDDLDQIKTQNAEVASATRGLIADLNYTPIDNPIVRLGLATTLTAIVAAILPGTPAEFVAELGGWKTPFYSGIWLFGPEMLVRMAAHLDLNFYRFSREPLNHERDQARWSYESLNYRLPENVVKEIWAQKAIGPVAAVHDHLITSSVGLKMLYERMWGKSNASISHIMVDRLTQWNARAGVQQSILYVRVHVRRPKYPRPVTETKTDADLASALTR